MGQKLLKIFEYVREKGGYPGRLRLCLKTKIISSKAGDIPDTPDVLERVRVAAREILEVSEIPV